MSDIQFIPYHKNYELPCISLLKSNLGDYFANEEVADFIIFLQDLNAVKDYCVGILNDQVVACGGWEKKGSTCYLRWGIVSGQHHNLGLGSKLLKYRIDQINRQFGQVDIQIRTSRQAHGFYERLGFYTKKIIKNGIAKGIDEFHMIRPHQ